MTRRLLHTLLLLYTVHFSTSVVIFSIPPHQEECVIIRNAASKQGAPTRYLEGNFEQIDDKQYMGAGPLVVFIMDGKQEKQLYSSKQKSSGSFRVALPGSNDETKKYWLCIQNHNDDLVAEDDSPDDDKSHDGHTRTVGVSYTVTEDLMQASSFEQVQVSEHTNQWLEKAGAIRTQIKNLMNHHEYMRVREAAHRQVTENTFAEILKWSLVEAMIVLSVAAGQVFYFRHYLERKRSPY